MLAEMSGATKSYTMFLVDKLRILFHSRHLSLKQPSNGSPRTTWSIPLKRREMSDLHRPSRRHHRPGRPEPPRFRRRALRRRGGPLSRPRSGEARKRGINVVGPVPAGQRILLRPPGEVRRSGLLYHDQGHIASKTYDFYRTVSVTFGLPFIRTSVDHGTAFDIAWQGIANPVSMKEAMLACFRIAPLYRPF